MTDQKISLNLGFRSFGNDENILTEEYFMIDDNTLLINQDFVSTTQIDPSGPDTTVVTLHLKDGITVEKTFSTSGSKLKEIRH